MVWSMVGKFRRRGDISLTTANISKIGAGQHPILTKTNRSCVDVEGHAPGEGRDGQVLMGFINSKLKYLENKMDSSYLLTTIGQRPKIKAYLARIHFILCNKITIVMMINKGIVGKNAFKRTILCWQLLFGNYCLKN